AHNADALARTSQPYPLCSRSPSRIRTRALTTPLSAIATKHHRATAENLRAARSACSPLRSAWARSASRPPAHTPAATKWMSRLLVAMSWEPPADEWPVSASGIRVTIDPAKSNGVQDHRSTGRLASMTAAAMKAVQRQAEAVSTRLATDQIADGLRRETNGCPVTSETVSGTSTAAQTVQTPDATVPRRSARSPAASSTPLVCAGTREA